MRKRVSTALILLTFCFLVTEALAQQAKAVIRVRGADSMAGRIDQLARIYMNSNPSVNIVVSGGSKEAAGLSEVIEKHAEVAMAASRATREELEAAWSKGIKLVERLVGYGGIVIITHPSNKLDDLTVEQVSKILSGQTTDWEPLGGTKEPIQVVTVGEAAGGTVTFMERDVLGGRPITKRATQVERFQAAVRMVAQTPGSVGFVRVRDASESPVAKEVSFKVLRLRKDASSPAVVPSRFTIADDSYPLKRPFYLYHEENAADEVKRFVDFIVAKGWGPQSI